MRVLLAGGGSGGSAAPVIAVGEALRELRPDVEILYLGTRNGPEESLVRGAGLRFGAVTSGRLRRYLTWRNLVDPGLVAVGTAEAALHVARFCPRVAFGAGGFATVPPLVAAWAFGARVMIHQQDAVMSLANRMLTPFAAKITVAFPESARSFPRKSVIAVGNPVRGTILRADANRGSEFLGMDASMPLVLAMGGGTGALGLNRIVADAAAEIARVANLVHLTGAGKTIRGVSSERYRAFEFLNEEFPDVLASADLVVSRSGMSSLAEMGALRKPAILVPMPDSHQELNAELVEKTQAGLVRKESELSGASLASECRTLLDDPDLRERLGEAAGRLFPADSAKRIAAELIALAER
jgi:UDP-N-acetylglucosamine--N-acetylmuramyl-(pentapeptide) pyrophosphoryl-undecaprenol N-acetylglucosamine transferase